MKFELDHRTGMMRPKKDDEIYFAQSQGGGLIVDDKKNDIKYIIERDGRITKLFGSFDKDNLNLYDMRDARIIADRVMRLLGRDHKYTDFHYFLRGYRMSESFIKTCSDFLTESIWSDMQDRSSGETVREEDMITTNEVLRKKIRELYKEQGEGETLDVSSLTNIIKCDDFSDIFRDFYKVKNIIGIEDWDVSEVTDMRSMFEECSSFNCDLSNWDVSSVGDMCEMFSGCINFNCDLSNWDVSSVGNMDSMFWGCENFNYDLSNWDVSSVEDMGFMFLDCKKFNCDLSKWKVSKVTNMHQMFWGCEKFNSDLSNWDVSNVNDMKDIFYNCKSLGQIPSWYMKKQSKITESIWSDIQDRSSGDTIKKEDGMIIGQLEDGTRLIISNDAFADGNLVDFDGENFYTLSESSDGNVYIAVINEGNTDVYYKYDEDSEDVVNMIECFETDDDLRKSNEFGALKAIMRQNEWDNGDFDDLDVDVLSDYVSIRVGQSYEFAVYEDRDKAINYAIDLEKDLLDSDVFTKYTVERFRNILGDDFFDEKSMETDLKDSMESYYNDLDEDDAIEELLRYNVIEDSEDYFGLDEDGDIDHSIPKFDYQYYGDVYAEKYIENIDDVIDEFISNFGYDGIENYIKYDRLAKLIVEADGPESTIASYDGVEREETVDGQTYYIYRVN